MSDQVRTDLLSWGILGTGNIARTFARALAQSTTGRLVAVASRTAASAETFGDEFDVPRRYEGYEALLADPDVDAIYISLPNHLHARWIIRCAEAGKHILCEKPLATNHAEAMAAIEHARRHDVFLMEAFMYRCHPQTARLAQLVRDGAIGQVRVIQAHFSFNMRGARPENIRQQNESAGGGIMDVGCYTASMVRLVAGAALGQDFADPIAVRGVGHLGSESRIDEWATAALRFPGDIVANITCGIQVAIDSTLRIWGSEGHILLPNPWFPREGENRIMVHHNGQDEPEEVIVEADAPLYTIEADMVARHIADRQAPSPCMTWADTLGNMDTLDRWRREIGLEFGNEKPDTFEPVAARPLARRADAPMQYGQVEGIDQPVSRIVLGSGPLRPGMFPASAVMLDHFFELGGNCVDTAYVYRTEPILGMWMKRRNNRADVIVIAKGAHTPFCDPESLTRQLYESLDGLQTDYVDLYFMHRDNPAVPAGEFVDVLNEHLRAGRIRAFGGSNWTTERIEAANEYARANGLRGFTASSPNLALARWNVPMWEGCIAASDPASRAWYAQTQLPLFAWSSQASGLTTGRYRPEDRDNPALAAVARTWFNDENFQRVERARQMAREKGVTVAQIGLAWVLSQPFPTHALIGPQTIDEMRDSIQALELDLTADEIRWLDLEA